MDNQIYYVKNTDRYMHIFAWLYHSASELSLRQPGILIKPEQTLPEYSNVLEILQHESCTPPFHYLIPDLYII